MGCGASTKKKYELHADGLHAFEEIGPGFFLARTSFLVGGGIADIGTHMALARLASGDFVALDTVSPDSAGLRQPSAPAESIKADIDRLTDCGARLVAVVGTHPYHTMFFRPFHEKYPGAKYYGTPRHLREQKDIPWAGDVSKTEVQQMFEPDLAMRLPPCACCEFDNPLPPASNHFSNVFVLHRPSKVLFNDDCVCYFHTPGKSMGRLASTIAGLKHDTLKFHHSMSSVGLRKTEAAPAEFAAWLEKLLADWDFDVLATAHNGTCRAGAKARLASLLEAERPSLVKLAEGNAKRAEKAPGDEGAWGKGADVECG